MKLKIYNAENSPHTKVTPGYHEAHITICRNGNITFNKYVLKILKDPERVLIVEDEDYRGDFYVVSSKDSAAFALGEADLRGSRSIQSSTLADRMAESLGVKLPAIIPVLDEPKAVEIGKAYPLAVKKARIIPKKPYKKQ